MAEREVVHLMTQRNQPYGSVRKCCERCGRIPEIYCDSEADWYALDRKLYMRCNESPAPTGRGREG